jgi:hypothetical protein
VNGCTAVALASNARSDVDAATPCHAQTDAEVLGGGRTARERAGAGAPFSRVLPLRVRLFTDFVAEQIRPLAVSVPGGVLAQPVGVGDLAQPWVVARDE